MVRMSSMRVETFWTLVDAAACLELISGAMKMNSLWADSSAVNHDPRPFVNAECINCRSATRLLQN